MSDAENSNPESVDGGVIEDVESLFPSDEGFDPRRAVEILTNKGECAKFEVGHKVGEGGMGQVYRVFDCDLKRQNVIKVLRPENSQNRQMFLSFMEEARITARLEHPNIIPVHSVGALDGEQLYFSMKEIDGEGLDVILQRIEAGEVGKYTLFNLLTLFRKVCDAVAFAHSHGIVHRDIKPENIMVGHYGEVLLVDWGLARDLRRRERRMAAAMPAGDELLDTYGRRLTRHGDIKGSPAYMSPEQAFGFADVIDERTDVFLLGATLYGIATLNAPYDGNTLREIVEHAQACEFEDPMTRAPNRALPPELCRIIVKAMAYEPDERYQAVTELIEDLDDLLAGETASELRVFQAGQLVMEEGEVGHEAFVIVQGSVEVFKTVRGEPVALMTLGEGDAFGEMAIIAQAPRSASVRALCETQVVVITEALIHQGLDKLPSWMGNVTRALVERIRTSNAHVHPLTYNSPVYHVFNQILMIFQSWGSDDPRGFPRVAVIQQVAVNLCIADSQVANIVDRAIAHELLASADEAHVAIPDAERLRRFLTVAASHHHIVDPFLGTPDEQGMTVDEAAEFEALCLAFEAQPE